ncbi:MAG: hypothetical protein M3Y18_09200, partial [Candidatus Eremiobacteraeota bacterium]|nr:hypothetical protein [Candidatus Eremiobacteraeota bacterium]
ALWPVATTACINIGLFDPVPNGLARELEFIGKFVCAATRSRELKDLKSKVGRVCPGMFSGHWWTLLC